MASINENLRLQNSRHTSAVAIRVDVSATIRALIDFHIVHAAAIVAFDGADGDVAFSFRHNQTRTGIESFLM